MQKIGFTRIDAKIRHIYVNDQGMLKVIDHVNSFRHHSSLPTMFFDDIDQLGLLDSFMNHAKNLDYKQFDEWNRALKKWREQSE